MKHLLTTSIVTVAAVTTSGHVVIANAVASSGRSIVKLESALAVVESAVINLGSIAATRAPACEKSSESTFVLRVGGK